jgi:hypothetical protein
VVGDRLSLEAFHQLAGVMGGYPFVKVVVEKNKEGRIHFISHEQYAFHVDYIAEQILHISKESARAEIDIYNERFYLSAQSNRDLFLGIISLHSPKSDRFFTLETVEIDSMNQEMIQYFYSVVRENLNPSEKLLFKPANHMQEQAVSQISPVKLPRIFNHELVGASDFIPLNTGSTTGRIRHFANEVEYRQRYTSIEWYDIIVMDRVPDDIPRVSGIINVNHTTPLSHTNVLASGWQIPNAIQLDVLSEIKEKNLDGAWVQYSVENNAPRVKLEKTEKPKNLGEKPAWTLHRVKLEEPETENTPVRGLEELRMRDRFRYGTKAANLGELQHILAQGSGRFLGFYRVPRPPSGKTL